MPADPLSSQRGLERQEEQGINTTAETDFTVLCLSLCREPANLFCYFPKSHAESSCAISVQVRIAGQLSGAAHGQKAGTVTVQTEGTGHMLPRHMQLLTSSEVRQVYVSQRAREQAALGIRLEEPAAAPQQQKHSQDGLQSCQGTSRTEASSPVHIQGR